MSRSILVTFPYSLGIPGGGTLDCVETARHLRAAGAHVTVLAVGRVPRFHSCGAPLDREREAALRERSIELVRVAPNPIHAFLDGLSIRKAVQSILAERRIDALFGWWTEVAFLPHLLRSRGVAFGVIAAASYSAYLTQPPSKLRQAITGMIRTHRLLRKPLRQADIVFARSRFTREEVIDLFRVDERRVHVAYCGVDSMFSRIPRVPRKEVSRLIFYGPLTPAKGVFEAIEALGWVAAQGRRDWIFKIAGWGDEEGVRRAACQHKVSDRILLLGRLEHGALARELEWAQLAILPSHAESFGLANAESQAAGLPVVAYRAGAVPEVVEEGVTGWLVATGDVNQLAGAVMEAIRDPQRTARMGLAARERATRLFSWQHTAATMLRGIDTLGPRTDRAVPLGHVQ